MERTKRAPGRTGPAQPQPVLARVPRRPRQPLPEPEVPAGAKDPRIVLGERVNALRVALGLSQEDFAGRVGLDRTYVSGIERGLRNPTLLVLLRLAQALEVSVTGLLEEPSSRQKGERPPAKR